VLLLVDRDTRLQSNCAGDKRFVTVQTLCGKPIQAIPITGPDSISSLHPFIYKAVGDVHSH